MKKVNEQLNKLPVWITAICVLCSRKYPATILNIEGHVNHGCNILCLDTKDCKKHRERINKLKKQTNDTKKKHVD
jgi:hypothetical protein